MRTVLLSGTPYNNRRADLVTLGSFIDSSSKLATMEYYADQADASRPALTPDFFLRRNKDCLRDQLPPKLIEHVEIRCSQ